MFKGMGRDKEEGVELSCRTWTLITPLAHSRDFWQQGPAHVVPRGLWHVLQSEGYLCLWAGRKGKRAAGWSTAARDAPGMLCGFRARGGANPVLRRAGGPRGGMRRAGMDCRSESEQGAVAGLTQASRVWVMEKGGKGVEESFEMERSSREGNDGQKPEGKRILTREEKME